MGEPGPRLGHMTFFVVTYTYVPDTELIAEHRPRHREFLAAAHNDGHLIASGPLTHTCPPKAVLIMRAQSADAVRLLLHDDPFNTAGVISDTTVEPWNPVLGVFSTENDAVS